MSKTIGIIGCGWLGKRIAKQLTPHYEAIYVTTTTEEKAETYKELGWHSHVVTFSNHEVNQTLHDDFHQLDALLISVPASRGATQYELTTRFQNIIQFIGSDYAGQLFYTSSTGIYPSVDQTITEQTFDVTQLKQRLLTIEQLLQRAFPQLVILRLGGLMGDDRYLAKYYQNKAVNKPGKRVNYIFYEDIASIVHQMMQKNLRSDLFNIVAPQHPTKQEVINHQTESKKDSPPAHGKRVSPSRVIECLNYEFRYPNPVTFPYQTQRKD